MNTKRSEDKRCVLKWKSCLLYSYLLNSNQPSVLMPKAFHLFSSPLISHPRLTFPSPMSPPYWLSFCTERCGSRFGPPHSKLFFILYFFFFWKRLNWFCIASAAFSVSGASRSMSISSSGACVGSFPALSVAFSWGALSTRHQKHKLNYYSIVYSNIWYFC